MALDYGPGQVPINAGGAVSLAIEKQMYWGITSASAASHALHLSKEWPSRWTPEPTPLEWLESRLYAVRERAWL